MATLYTIGHSTRELSELISAIQAHGIQCLYDIRAFPRSRRWPHFNRENLEKILGQTKVIYRWEPDMGGRRSQSKAQSPNLALRNHSFRSYADYMLTARFQEAAAKLLKTAETMPTAYMCAERVYFRCHRMLVSDYYVVQGHTVLHIDNEKPARAHKLTAVARVRDGRLIYPDDQRFQRSAAK